MITSISTLRHAKTSYNVEKRYTGSIDIPLSEEGRRQAQRAAAMAKALRFDVVVTSRLRRAYETAQIISAGPIPIVRTRQCNERHFGILEGLTWDDVPKLQPPVLMISVGADLHTVNPRDGEPFEDVWGRAKRFRRFLFRRFGGRKILVVSHGVFLQMFHGALRGLTCIESLSVYPASLQVRQFEFDDESLMKESVIELGDGERSTW